MEGAKPSARNDDGDDLLLGEGSSSTSDNSSGDSSVYEAQVVATPHGWTASAARRIRPRRKLLPLNLFILTCFSTFLAGVTHWHPWQFLVDEAIATGSLIPLRTAILMHWQDGLIYTACVLSILFTHEMGHFLATLRYRIPASFPFFIPLPISPIGTMGAVIGMDGMRANRREMFDIGIAGPLAGLLVAVPITWIGVAQLDLTVAVSGPYLFDSPLAVRWIMDAVQPAGYQAGQMTAHSQLNPYFMAGWVGLLVTGLNMMPVGQLDGGHITYALFGKKAHWIARVFMVVAIVSMLVGAASQGLALMAILVLFMIGTDHPPTSDDTVRLGFGRIALGVLSLSIPIFCFAPKLIVPVSYTTEIRVPAQQADQDQTATDQRPPGRSLISRLAAPSQKDPHRHEDWLDQHEPGRFVSRNSLHPAREQPIRQSHLQHAEGT
ncbi:MAG: site-2 protease family protein [Pirellulaceae bacterium]